jgi:hypothetical protein
MRKFFFFFLCTAMCCTAVTAQDGKRIRERLQAERAAIYTNVLNLTPTEAEGFWPVYNKFLDDREAVQKELKRIHNNTTGLSDKDAEETVRKHFELRQRELDLEKDMVQKVRKVIPMQKVALLPEAERQFRKTILERARERRQDRTDDDN